MGLFGGIGKWLGGSSDRRAAKPERLGQRCDFFALDFETADSDHRVCSVGVVGYREQRVVWHWATLVDPGVPVAPRNYSVHLIDDEDLRGAPTFGQCAAFLRETLDGMLVAAHGNTEATALRKEYERLGDAAPSVRWLDTHRLSKRVWPDLREAGYRLDAVCDFLGFDFDAHDALEDARASGEIVLRAMIERKLDLEALLELSNHRAPSANDYAPKITRAGASDGEFAGQAVVFTGALSMTREEAADLAARHGLDVKSGVSKKVSVLVVGDQDLSALAGHTKSTKHRKAEELQAGGHSIRIVGETEFLRMLGET